MRAALLALLIATTSGCASKADPKLEPVSGGAAEPGTSTAGGASTAGGERPRTASEQAQDKLTEAESARGEAATKDQIKKEAADEELAKTRKVTATQLQSDFDTSDRRFIALKDQIAKATGAKKQKATTASAEIAKQEAAVMASIAKLRDASGTAWETTKTQLDAELSALNKSIDSLEITLK